MRLGWTDEMHTVAQVRAHKRVLSGFMTSAEIAAHLGVSPQTLRRYAADPGTTAYRAIPADKLARLRDLVLATLLKKLEMYHAAA